MISIRGMDSRDGCIKLSHEGKDWNIGDMDYCYVPCGTMLAFCL